MTGSVLLWVWSTVLESGVVLKHVQISEVLFSEDIIFFLTILVADIGCWDIWGRFMSRFRHQVHSAATQSTAPMTIRNALEHPSLPGVTSQERLRCTVCVTVPILRQLNHMLFPLSFLSPLYHHLHCILSFALMQSIRTTLHLYFVGILQR